MATINLLPTNAPQKKHTRQKKPVSLQKALIPVSLNKPVIILGCVYAALIIILFSIVTLKTSSLSSVTQHINKLNAEYRKRDALKEREGKLAATLDFLKQNASLQIPWSAKLLSLAKALLPSIWLTDISVETKHIKQTAAAAAASAARNKAELSGETIKTFVIKGAATSLIDTEILASITQFVELLKNDSSFSNDFRDIKLGSLQSRKLGDLNVMDFTVYCTFNH